MNQYIIIFTDRSKSYYDGLIDLDYKELLLGFIIRTMSFSEEK